MRGANKFLFQTACRIIAHGYKYIISCPVPAEHIIQIERLSMVKFHNYFLTNECWRFFSDGPARFAPMASLNTSRGIIPPPLDDLDAIPRAVVQ